MDTPTPIPNVQHITKKSSDELLRKFADDHSPKRRKKSRLAATDDALPLSLRSLLPPHPTRKPPLIRQLAVARSHLRARDFRNKSLFRTIHKTWRTTVEGASRVFMEKHYHRHKRLINDIV